MSHSPDMTTPFSLSRNALGQLVFQRDGQAPHTGAVPVRSFPIAAPDEAISLVGADGHELAWIEVLADVPEPTRGLIQEELAQRDFFPEIRRIVGVSSFSTPSTWTVETDRGATEFVLKGEEDIRRLPGLALLILSGHGLQFLVPDTSTLDRHSRQLLGRFL